MPLRSNLDSRLLAASKIAVISLLASMACAAQTAASVITREASDATIASLSPAMAAEVLPDAPSAAASSSSVDTSGGYEIAAAGVARQIGTRGGSREGLQEASRTQSIILEGQVAPKLTAGQTAYLGFKNTFSLVAAAGWFTSAGYDQLRNSSPNYGTDRGAFGERLGAAALCNSSEDLLTDSVMAPLLHEDPRYYRMGRGHNFFVRVAYAATRPIITRTTSGRTTPNLALILGNAEGSALTNAYYPQVNRGMEQTMETLGLSIGGSAIGDAIAEFYGDVLKTLRMGY